MREYIVLFLAAFDSHRSMRLNNENLTFHNDSDLLGSRFPYFILKIIFKKFNNIMIIIRTKSVLV